jgi:hypothetical protein
MKEDDETTVQGVDITSTIETSIGYEMDQNLGLQELPEYSIEPLSDRYDPFERLKEIEERLKATTSSSPEKISTWYQRRLDDIEIQEAVFRECLEGARYSRTITGIEYMRAHRVLASTSNPFYRARQEAIDIGGNVARSEIITVHYR